MKMVAAAKLRRAQEAAESGRPYVDRMRRVTANLAAKADVNSAPALLVGNGKSTTHLLVVISADRGLCGGFNSNICKLAKAHFNKTLEQGKNLKIITVGSKGLDQIKRDYGN